MKPVLLLLLLFSTAGISLSLDGCKASGASQSRPSVLHYAFSPQAEQMQSGSMRPDLMKKYLEGQLHIPVEVVRVESYSPTIEAMRAEKVDIAQFGSLAYIIAAQKAGAQAIISRGNPDGSLGGYRSVIAVSKDSPYQSLADLRSHSHDIVFAFADPASTSGNLYPRVGLQNVGIDPERDFKKVVFANGHPAAVMTLKAGKVDAAGFMQAAPNRLIATGRLAPGDIRVIWTSELIPDSAIAVRKALPEDLKRQIQDAFLHMQDRDPELWTNLQNTYRGFSNGVNTKYIAVTDSTYDGLRRYATQVKSFNFVEK
jgi:phosphonate transport system substrate-binding protein